MILQILLRRINFEFLLIVAARRFVLAIFVPAATSSIMVIRTLGSLLRRSSGSVAFYWNTSVGTLADVC